MIYKPLVMSNEEYHDKTKYESSTTARKVYHTEKGERVVDLIHQEPPAYQREQKEEHLT